MSTTPIKPRELLTTSEVASRLRVSVRTVQRMARDEQLRRVRIRGAWRIVAADVDALIAPASTSGSRS